MMVSLPTSSNNATHQGTASSKLQNLSIRVDTHKEALRDSDEEVSTVAVACHAFSLTPL